MVNIIGRYDNKTGMGQQTKSFIHTLKNRTQINFIETRPESSDTMDPKFSVKLVDATKISSLKGEGISIFTDVVSNGSLDNNFNKVPTTTIKLACVIFDSTRIPRRWVNIIETHFDGVIVSSLFLVDALKKSGVVRPIFYLPLAVSVDEYKSLPPRLPQVGKPFTFLAAGLVERRKNLHIVIKAFQKAFKPTDTNVKLVVKLSEIIDSHYHKQYFSSLEKYAGSNIEFVTARLPKDKYIELLQSADCFVSASGGEGFSLIPRESIALGKPAIITNALAQTDICESGLVEVVPCNIPVPAYYPQINSVNPYVGVAFEPYVEDLVKAFRNIYDQKPVLFTSEKINARKKWMERFSYESLSPLYQSLVTPKQIEKGIENVILKDKIVIADHWLFKKYEQIFKDKAVIKDTDKGAAKKVVVQVNDGGFFSVFNTLVSYLVWELHENPDSVVFPDWRIKKLKERFGNDIKNFCYGTEADGNIWLKLFEPIAYKDIDDSVYNKELELYQNAVVVNNWNEFREPLLTYIHAYKLYKKENFQKWREWYNSYYKKYLKVRPHIKESVDRFVGKYFDGKKVIAAHIRHPSHGMEQPGGRLPTVELFCEKITELIKQQNWKPEEYVLFIATDQDSVIEYFKKYFPDNLVYSGDVKRVTAEDDMLFKKLSAEEQLKEGHQIQHKTAADPSKWSVSMAEEVVIDALLLAESDYFIHVTSNIATAVSFMNPKTKMIYCE
ncbi:MAG: glycosyltransferase [Candidatus Doudnabacteria bacterium]|nr:glycosyltransferase [Candidatus Doudnabacteria bacterium]